MKKQSNTDISYLDDRNQENINNLKHNLMTILDSFTDEMNTEELFCNAIKFVTLFLYERADDPHQPLRIIKSAITEAIRTHMENKEHE